MRMLASTLRRNIRDRAFENFQECLLHAFAGHIPRNRRVFILAANFVNFVNVDNSLLRQFDFTIRRLQQFENNIFDIFANVARFRERRSINNRERNFQHPRQCLR